MSDIFGKGVASWFCVFHPEQNRNADFIGGIRGCASRLALLVAL